MTRWWETHRWIVAFALLLLPGTASGQGRWTVDASVGQIHHDALIPRIGTSNIALGVRYAGETAWMHGSAGGPLPGVGDGGLYWGVVGGGQRMTRVHAPWTYGVQVTGDVYSYGGSRLGEYGGGATAQAMPLAGWRNGPVEAEVRSGLWYNRVVIPGERTHRAVHDSEMRLGWNPGAGLALTGGGRWLSASEASYGFLGAAAQWAYGRASAWAAAGQWMTDEIPEPTYTAGIGARLSDRMSVTAEWQQDGGDPLYWNAPRQMWSMRLTRSIGRVRSRPVAPVLPEVRSGRVTLRLPLDASTSPPSVIGDFTDWEAVPMVRAGDRWELTFPVRPGVYHYVYRTADGVWYLPNSITHRVSDGMGGWNAVLVVPEEVGR